jgi:transcriptional regulator with XRE-family HTH domain
MTSDVKENGIKKIREMLGMSQAAFAQAIGKRPSAVSNYETGRREPDSDTAYAILDLAKNAGIPATLETIYLRQ